MGDSYQIKDYDDVVCNYARYQGNSIGKAMVSQAEKVEVNGQTKFDFSRVSVSRVEAGTYAVIGQGNNANASGCIFVFKTLEEVEVVGANSGEGVDSKNRLNYLGETLPNLSRKDIIELNSLAIIMGSTVITGYSEGPQVGAFVSGALTIPATAIATVTTLDAWGDYYRLDNRKNGDYIRAWSNTVFTLTGVLNWPAAIPAAAFGIADQNGAFDGIWGEFNK